jgi:hypothetical protein
LKRLLDTWDRNGSTSGPTAWQIYIYRRWVKSRYTVYNIVFMVFLRYWHLISLTFSYCILLYTYFWPTLYIYIYISLHTQYGVVSQYTEKAVSEGNYYCSNF